MELRPPDDRDPPRRSRSAGPRHGRGGDLLGAFPHQAATAAGARADARRPAGAADRRARPHRRAVRGLSPRDPLRFSGHHPGDRHGQGQGAADRRHHLEPHARDPRRAEAAVLLLLGRLPGRQARAHDPQGQGAGGDGRAEPRDRRLRTETAHHRSIQAARGRRDDRLDAGLDAARCADADPGGDQRHARRAAQVPGRYRQDPGQRGTAPAHPGQGRARSGERLASQRPAGMSGHLLANLMYFARTLRAAGLPIGPGKVLAAVEAVRTVGITNRADFYWALHATLVNRRDQREIFDQAFHIFWRNPQLLEKMMSLVLPQLDTPGQSEGEEMIRRLAEAMHPRGAEGGGEEREEDIEIDATMTFSDRELLREMDFEKMSLDELAQAKAAIKRMRLPEMAVPTRRFVGDPTGARADMRATLRAALRAGGLIALRRKRRRTRPPPLVILCDISGSMHRYSRLFLHFMHAVTTDRDRVHTFLFGTRLTNVTRHLRHRDVDVSLDKVPAAVEDWSGGTRIGQCLAEFNLVWSRRVLGQGAVVIFISDGLDRDAGDGLGREMDRLHKSCRRLIWLNPLLRYDAFEPKSLGMRAILPHVDEFRPVQIG